MKLKRLVIFVVVACMVCATPVQASQAKWIKKTGKYESGISNYKLKGKNKKKYYKKNYGSYGKKLGFVIKVKKRKKSWTLWGTFIYKKKGKKKFMKYRKYKFRFSKNFVVLGWMPNRHGGGYHLEKASKKEANGLLKHPVGSCYTLYVKHGVLYKVTVGG